MQVSVQNGTRAGWRRIHSLIRRDWRCPTCGKTLKYYWTRCPSDGHPRTD